MVDEAVLNAAPENELIRNTMKKADLLLNSYKNPVCSVSGGSDSDTHPSCWEQAGREGKQNGGWISVNDRLPDNAGKYLVFYHEWSNGTFLPVYNSRTIRIMRFLNNGMWCYPSCIDTRCEEDTNRAVTHWMPLPEPPEEVD